MYVARAPFSEADSGSTSVPRNGTRTTAVSARAEVSRTVRLIFPQQECLVLTITDVWVPVTDRSSVSGSLFTELEAVTAWAEITLLVIRTAVPTEHSSSKATSCATCARQTLTAYDIGLRGEHNGSAKAPPSD